MTRQTTAPAWMPISHSATAPAAQMTVMAAHIAGDALAILGDADAALAHFQEALPLAQQAKDFTAIRDLSARIFRLTRPATGETVQRRQPRSRPARSQRKGRR